MEEGKWSASATTAVPLVKNNGTQRTGYRWAAEGVWMSLRKKECYPARI